MLKARAFGSGTVGLFVGVGARGWVEAEGDGYRSMGSREGVGIGVGMSAVGASVGGR